MSDKEPSILYIDPCQVQELGRLCLASFLDTHTKVGEVQGRSFPRPIHSSHLETRLLWVRPYGNRMQSFFFKVGGSALLDSFVPIGMMVNDLLYSLDKSNNTLDQHHRTASIVYISENRSWTYYSRPKLAHLSRSSENEGQECSTQ